MKYNVGLQYLKIQSCVVAHTVGFLTTSAVQLKSFNKSGNVPTPPTINDQSTNVMPDPTISDVELSRSSPNKDFISNMKVL